MGRQVGGSAFDDSELEVLLGPGHPEDAADEQPEEMGEVHVGAVEQNDLPRADTRAHLACAGIVVVAGGVDEAKRGNRLCRSSRKWHLAAAFRRRCLAQLMHEAIS